MDQLEQILRIPEAAFGYCPRCGYIYEIGTFHATLGLEGFEFKSTFRRRGRDNPSGIQHGNPQFVRCGDRKETERALLVVYRHFQNLKLNNQNNSTHLYSL